MHKNRMEAFSDGVLAIIVTIMVLEMKVPAEGGATLSALRPVLPEFLSYVLSFAMVLIYWNNHHHLLQPVRKVSGKVLLANGHLLFWLSLLPFTTAWMGKNHFASVPVALFGIDLLLSAIAYEILTQILVREEGKRSVLSKAVGKDSKGYVSLLAYGLAIPLAFWYPLISCCLYGIVAIIWLVPDQRIERQLTASETGEAAD